MRPVLLARPVVTAPTSPRAPLSGRPTTPNNPRPTPTVQGWITPSLQACLFGHLANFWLQLILDHIQSTKWPPDNASSDSSTDL